MRDAIRALPDGVYTSTITNNPLGTPMTYPVKLTIAGDAIDIDFAGAPPQLPQGGLNCTLNYTAAHATYPLKCMLTPGMRGNAGCYSPFTVSAPEGSVLNCTYPAAVNIRTRTGWYLAPNIFRALAEAAPGRCRPTPGLRSPPMSMVRRPTAASIPTCCSVAAVRAVRPAGDGHSALLWPTSAANTSIELIESRVPVLILEKTYLPDSGGPGRHRGGLGQRRALQKARR
jgi:5-oxoprolinase (ATP-hydrolysing)